MSCQIGLLRDRSGRVALVHFRFNSWGERYLPYDPDAQVPEDAPLISGCGGTKPRSCSKPAVGRTSDRRTTAAHFGERLHEVERSSRIAWGQKRLVAEELDVAARLLYRHPREFAGELQGETELDARPAGGG